MLFDHFLKVASNETLSSQDTRNMLELWIKASQFEKQEFTKAASTQYVGMLVFSMLVAALQRYLEASFQPTFN